MAEIALEAVVDFPVLAVAEASQARIAVAEYFLLILAWIVEVVDLAREVADLEATEDRLVATEAASVATEEATAITEDPLVVEDLAEDSEEVSGIIEDIFNAS